jgi:hypothetical protein
MISLPCVVLALVGFVEAFRRDPREPQHTAALRASALLFITWLGAQVMARDVIENRYFLPALFPLFILVAAGIERASRAVAGWTTGQDPGDRRRNTVAWGAAAVLAIWCIATLPDAPIARRAGYAAVADAVTSAGGGPAVLVSSDPPGEGALIVEALIRDGVSSRVLVRASKLLSSSDWMGGNYRLLAASPAAVLELLDAVPVRFVVLDDEGLVDAVTRPHHELLDRSIQQAPDRFRLVGEFPLHAGTRRGRVRIYENRLPLARTTDTVRLPASVALGQPLDVRADARVGLARSGETGIGRVLQAGARWLATRLPPSAGGF